MATITIRNLSDDVVERIKKLANENGRSMEQEVRELLEARYAARKAVTHKIRQRWHHLPTTSVEEMSDWKMKGQNRDS